jgi:hypothetical protein
LDPYEFIPFLLVDACVDACAGFLFWVPVQGFRTGLHYTKKTTGNDMTFRTGGLTPVYPVPSSAVPTFALSDWLCLFNTLFACV